ncbi:PITH domain-containing protein, partial [Bisporella sp. PMI_857]
MLSGAGQSNSYTDVTAQVNLNGSDMVGWNSRYGDVRTLFDPSEPSGKGDDGKSKRRSTGSTSDCDWVESIDDPRLILSISFRSSLHVQALHITSFPSVSPDDSGSEIAMRPGTIRVFATTSGIHSLDDVEDIIPTQSIDLTSHWVKATGTAEIKLHSLKFKNVRTLVVHVVDGDGSGTHVRMDRLRVFG